MKFGAAAAILILQSQQTWAQQSVPAPSRAAFRQAVEDYLMFVVVHCAPDEVRAYIAARRERDEAFVKSLRKSKLASDYKLAVAHRAAEDSQTVYECMGPPAPPGAPRPDPGEIEEKRRAGLAEHFEQGDRQFAKMVQLETRFYRRANNRRDCIAYMSRSAMICDGGFHRPATLHNPDHLFRIGECLRQTSCLVLASKVEAD